MRPFGPRRYFSTVNEVSPVVVVLGDHVDADAIASEHARVYGFDVLRVDTIGIRAYSARVPQASFAALGRDPRGRCFRLDRRPEGRP